MGLSRYQALNHFTAIIFEDIIERSDIKLGGILNE